MKKELIIDSTPIHDIPDDELDLILENAKTFIEWNIEPKLYHLDYLVQSIKNSYVYFFPEDKDLIKGINTGTAQSIIKSFKTGELHPLYACLIALVEIFNVINSDGKTFKRFQIKYPINDYLQAIKPYVQEEKLKKYSKVQSEKGGKSRTVRGLTPEQRKNRDQEIFEAYTTANKKTGMTAHSFANRHCHEYNRSITQIRNIIRKSK